MEVLPEVCNVRDVGLEIKPFHFYHNMEERHLDPTHMLLCWIRECRITEGFLFRRFMANDRISAEDKPLVVSTFPTFVISLINKQSQDLFSEYFRHNMVDIGRDPLPYGTHSFRRGGCQYLCSEKRWGIRKLCDWGGWSLDFDNTTIVRYLLSWNDDPTMRREDFLNPGIQIGRLCNYCGRKCACNS
jgi:hypothetical protein